MRAAAELQGPVTSLEQVFNEQQVKIETWLREQWQQVPPLFYGSVDLRNAGFKVAPVDTNLFPAGFNNLNPAFMSLYVQALQATIAEICPKVTRLLLIPESHSRNIFYFENIAFLVEIIRNAGFDVRIGSVDPNVSEPITHQLPSGKHITLEPLARQGDAVGVGDFFPCCIILNNDLSGGVPEILQGVSQTINPAIQLGWSTRLKSGHFHFYDKVATEFASAHEIDSWLINPYFDQCPEVDFMQKEGQECLVSRAEALLKRIQKKYDEYQIKEPPFLVVKADQGTYGMAVMMIRDPNELRELNRKQRTNMAKAKGGATVTKAFIQEGVYSFENIGENASVAEPVIYSFGRHVIGGFYRVHEKRGPDENLNAPGMDFQPMPIEDPCNMPTGRFYVYGVITRLAMLAAARECVAFSKET